MLKDLGCLNDRGESVCVTGGVVPVKEELVVHERVIRTQLHDLKVGGGPGQEPQPGIWQLLQHPPEHLVPHPANIEGHSLVELPGLGDDEGVRHGLLLRCRGAQVGVGGGVILVEGYYLIVPGVEILHKVVVIILIACPRTRSILYIVYIL